MNTPKHEIHKSDSEMTLKPMLKEACLKHNVPDNVQAEIIKNGVKHFSVYSDGSIMPKGFYQTVDEYVEQNRKTVPQIESPGKSTKEELLVEMARYARTGNVASYRKCRKQYSECG